MRHVHGRARTTWYVLLAVILTAVFGLLAYNLFGGEKRIEHRLERLYATEDPQFSGNWASCWGRQWLAATPIAC